MTQNKDKPVFKSDEHRYAVIIAGGSGTRLWPMSRKNAPKQFQKIFGSQTLIQLMYQLLREVLTPNHIFVQADKRFKSVIAEQLPELPEENILIEPEARDTGPAIGFATASVLKRDPEAKMGVFWSDHVIKNSAQFVNALETAFIALDDFPENIISIGIKPAYPHTGLGYIQMKNEAKSYESGEVFYVERFLEKPDLKTAEKFVKSWEYLWNTGYSVFKAANLFNLIEQFDSETAQTLKKISNLIGKEDKQDEISELFKVLPKISIDYMVMEKVSDLMVIPADLEWSDIGDWKSLHNIMMEVNGHHMITRGNHVGIGCENCLIYAGDRMIATLGLKNVIVVDTGDAILIADKDEAQNIKKLVAHLEENDKHTYL